MRLMELNDEQRFRVRHTIREYGYEAIDALIGLAKQRDLEMPEMIQVFSEEIRAEAKHFGKEKAPEMVTTSTEAKEVSTDNSSTTNPENPDPAKLIKEAAKKKTHPFTEEQAAEIRRLRAEGKSAEWLANKFGVSIATIYNKLSTAPKKEKEAWINKNTTPTAEYTFRAYEEGL